jgi:hypothetical protein
MGGGREVDCCEMIAMTPTRLHNQRCRQQFYKRQNLRQRGRDGANDSKLAHAKHETGNPGL